jgi:hypothetical protein
VNKNLKEEKMGKNDELLTAGKIAQALNAKPADVKKAIAALKLEPDAVKGGCSYFGPSKVEKIKAKLD